MLKREIPKTIEEDGACGCVQVAGVWFNGPIFPQIDLGRRKRRRVGLTVLHTSSKAFIQVSVYMQDGIPRTLSKKYEIYIEEMKFKY